MDEDGFARFSVPVGEVEAAVGQDVSQIVAEGNFGPSANWAEFGLAISGDRATGLIGPLEPGHYYYQVTADDNLTVKDPTNATSVARHASAIAGVIPTVSPAAATALGDGVSPRASAAAIGSPPGSAADTASADAGRSAGSFARH